MCLDNTLYGQNTSKHTGAFTSTTKTYYIVILVQEYSCYTILICPLYTSLQVQVINIGLMTKWIMTSTIESQGLLSVVYGC